MDRKNLPQGFESFADDRGGEGGIFRIWFRKVGPLEPFKNKAQCWAFAELVAAPFVEEALLTERKRIAKMFPAIARVLLGDTDATEGD